VLPEVLAGQGQIVLSSGNCTLDLTGM